VSRALLLDWRLPHRATCQRSWKAGLATVLTCAVVGLDGAFVEVEANIGFGLPAFTVVGLPEAAVQESRERVRAAVKNAGCVFPMRWVTVNLAPVDLKKEGPLLLTDWPVLP
jgi:magnesium chelatase family protein